jgi:hypothetical protein
MCLDVYGPYTADGTPAQMWTCNGAVEEQWRLVPGQIVGYGGTCLDVYGPYTADATAFRCRAASGRLRQPLSFLAVNGPGGMRWRTS